MTTHLESDNQLTAGNARIAFLGCGVLLALAALGVIVQGYASVSSESGAVDAALVAIEEPMKFLAALCVLMATGLARRVTALG